MTNVFSPAQARIPIGTVTINGKQFEVAINIEWARFFESLTVATNTNTQNGINGRNGADGPAVALLGGDAGGDNMEFIPGPKGDQGIQGPQGPALFIVQDNETNDVFWPIKAG